MCKIAAINKIATHLMVFNQNAIQMFTGNFEQYLEACQAKRDKKKRSSEEERLLVEYRLADVLHRLSVAKDDDELARLDEEYRSLLAKVK